jgi:hypothetical protein
MIKAKPFSVIPKFSITGAGYSRKNKGLNFTWVGFCVILRKPINER